MSNRKIYFVSPTTKQGSLNWKVKLQNSNRASVVCMNKDQAIKVASQFAKKVQLGQVKIQDQHGKIQKEYTYGSDPEKYKG